jgi:hypothetical protein
LPAKPQPYKPFEYTDQDVAAIQAVAYGNASESQQRLAMKWIIENAGTHDLPYRPNDRDTTFACGMQHVGKQIIKMIHIDLKALKEQK